MKDIEKELLCDCCWKYRDEQELDSDGLNAAYVMGFQDGKKAERRERSDRWVNLTDDEIDNINYTSAHMLAREVEVKLKEKNT